MFVVFVVDRVYLTLVHSHVLGQAGRGRSEDWRGGRGEWVPVVRSFTFAESFGAHLVLASCWGDTGGPVQRSIQAVHLRRDYAQCRHWQKDLE